LQKNKEVSVSPFSPHGIILNKILKIDLNQENFPLIHAPDSPKGFWHHKRGTGKDKTLRRSWTVIIMLWSIYYSLYIYGFENL